MIRKHAVDKQVPDGLETIILTRMYKHMKLKEKQDYHWHVVVGNVHPNNQAHLYTLLSNHSLAVKNSKNEKEFIDGRPLTTLH